MFLKIISTYSSASLLILRTALGVVMFAHGAQKMMGWFGGHGISWTVDMWSVWFGFPAFITLLVILGEFFGGLALIAGFMGRLMAGSTALIMVGALYFVHFRWGFFMNWYTEQDRGEGFEFHILVLALVMVILLNGSGKFSVDYWIQKKYFSENPNL